MGWLLRFGARRCSSPIQLPCLKVGEGVGLRVSRGGARRKIAEERGSRKKLRELNDYF